MPNIKSAKKRVKVNAVKALNNQMAKSELKTTLKKFDAAIAAGDKAEATVAYTTAVKAVDQAAAKHLLHKNNASNKKSKMTTKHGVSPVPTMRNEKSLQCRLFFHARKTFRRISKYILTFANAVLFYI